MDDTTQATAALEVSSEHEKPLEEGQKQPEKEHPPTNLEQVREETSSSLESGLEFWRTSFGQENAQKPFMQHQNGARRELLQAAAAVVSDKAAFNDPEQLKAMLQKMARDVSHDVALPENIVIPEDSSDQTGASTAELTASTLLSTDENLESADLERLQEQFLSVVHAFIFEQLYADLAHCKDAIHERTAQVLAIRENAAALPPDKIHEAIPLFEQFQVDENIFGQYLAHGEALMRIVLRCEGIKTEAAIHLKEIIESYAETTSQEDIGKVIQIADDRTADPVTYFENERNEVTGGLLDQGAFLKTAETLREKLLVLQEAPTEAAAAEVVAAEESLRESVGIDESVPKEEHQAAPQQPTAQSTVQPPAPAPEEVGANFGGGDFRA